MLGLVHGVSIDVLGARSTANAAAGTRVLDVCDEIAAPVSFSCRSATCGTCRVHVLEGSSLVASPDEEETAVLRDAGAAPDERLACRLVVIGSSGRLSLRATQPRSTR